MGCRSWEWGLVLILLQRLLLRNQDHFVTVGGRGSRPLHGQSRLAQVGLIA
jgi:hypothetical protein